MTMIYPTNNEQGFRVVSTMMESEKTFKDISGIILPTKSTSKITVLDLYAKSNTLLIDHMLDVGYIAEAIMRYGPAKSVMETFSKRFSIETEELISSITFLCATHDIGKASSDFLYRLKGDKNKDICEKLEAKGLMNSKKDNFRHELYSRQIIKKWFQSKGFSNETTRYADIISFHHQGKTLNLSPMKTDDSEEWSNIQHELLNRVEEHWQFSNELGTVTYGANGLSYYILAIMVTADWIASGELWKAHKDQFGSNLKSAREFLDRHEMKWLPIQKRLPNMQWNNVFNFNPNEMQKKVSQAAKGGFTLMLIEDLCGGGKTEAALVAAYLAGIYKSGIYFAAPTTATAKALTERIRKIAELAGIDINIPELDSSAIWSDDEMDRIPRELWSSKSRHHMLYPFAVGTVDQLLKTVGSFKYSCIGTLGLSDKVVIIDEVHAYDEFMLAELELLIKWCRFLNVPVILLSATLPTKTRKKLLTAAGCKKDVKPSNKYPLITTVKNGVAEQTSFQSTGKKIKVIVKTTKNTTDEMFTTAINHQAGCLTLICETVDKAWELYDKVTKSVNDAEIMLFHGRDSIAHKTQKTNAIVAKLGKNKENRPVKFILITTPIMEQSIDADSDFLDSVIAPIDLWIQRLGRWRRHDDAGTIREKRNLPNEVTVVIPEDLSSIYRIYNKQVIDNTIALLKKTDTIDTVQDIRHIIDTVYDERTLDTKEEYISRLNAGRHIITSPFSNEFQILNYDSVAYTKLSAKEAQTREESYPTRQIAIVTPEEIEDCSFANRRHIYLDKAVTVPEYKIHEFSNQEQRGDLIPDISLYKSDNDTIETDNTIMSFTKDGLKWTQKTKDY